MSRRPALAAVATGIAAVVVAYVVGVLLAAVLAITGLTTTPVPTLGAWLAGAGLLGGWSQEVTATVAGGLEWSTWAAGAPLLVTLAVIGTVAREARRSELAGWSGAGLAAAGAVLASMVLVVASRTSVETVTAAGSVTRTEGLTWLWTGGAHPGTLVGAALLVGGAWLANTVGLNWWRQGRAFAYGLLVWPGLLLTLLVGAAVAYLTSSPVVGVATVLLFPAAGVLLVLGLAGSPVTVGITRLTPEPYVFSTWDAGLVYGVVGLVAALVLAVVVGAVLRLRRHRGGAVAAVTVPVAVALVLVWATESVVVVPGSLGGATAFAGGALTAATVAALMAGAALLVRGPSVPGPADVEESRAAPAA